MDFFERQDKARRNTRRLVVYFIAGVSLLIVSVYLAALLIFTGIGSTQRHGRYGYVEADPELALWRPNLFLGAAIGTLAVIALGSLFKTFELARGGSAVATMMGGRLVNTNTNDPDERKLLNVVEEMAIASGVPVPQVYVMDDESGINAFAAGHTTSDAVVSVTLGAIKSLTRDELQGVIGHEFSHILNGDMRLNLRLMGLIFGILCLAVIGRILLQSRSRNSRDKNPLPLLGLALLVIGWVGVFFGHLIQAAVSRQREFLADASSVQFTRNPAGLVGALKKIGSSSCGSELEAAHAAEASHMFFGNGIGESWFHLMDTHPPLAERIRALDPNFDGNLTPARVAAAEAAPALAPTSATRPPIVRLPGFPGRPAALAGLAAQSVMPSVGNPTTAHLRYAEELRAAIPDSLQAAARQPLGACTLIYGLLLSDGEPARQKQLDELATATSPAIVQETARLYPEVTPVATHAKLPLVDLALPALSQLSPAQFQQFRAAVQVLVQSDNQIDLFEYALQKIVLRHLEPQFSQARKAVIQYYSLKPLAPDCAVLLSALAYAGQDELGKVERAFQQGAEVLGQAAGVPIGLVPAAGCDLTQVDSALNRLSQAVPQIKKNVLAGCIQTVSADGLVQESEAELLRAIADTIDCPLPPLIPS